MKKIIFILIFLIISFQILGCNIFGANEHEKFQLVVKNRGKTTAIVLVNGNYAGRAYPHEVCLLGYFEQDNLTHLKARTEVGKTYTEKYVNTNGIEKYEWTVALANNSSQ